MTVCLTSLYGHNVSNWLLIESSWPSLLKRDFSETCHQMTVFPSQRLSTVTPVQCGNISFTHLITIFQLWALKLKALCCSIGDNDWYWKKASICSYSLFVTQNSLTRTLLHFTPWKELVPICRRLGGPQARSGQVRKISPPPGFDPQNVQPVASRYTAAHQLINNNNNNNIYLLRLGCHPVAVGVLHVNKTWNWLLINLSREGYMRSM